MACYHPNFMVKIEGSVTINGKQAYKYVQLSDIDRYPADKLIRVPCGKCIGCRLAKSREWANRCLCELEYHDSAFFCTFTYDNEHVPIGWSVDKMTGEAVECMTLRKRDWVLQMKRIRRRFEDDHIRFFACGEYGSETFRPHYHAILFGLHLSDLAFYKTTDNGDILYNSASLDRCWSGPDGLPFGHVVVSRVTWNTCAYVARYTAKKCGTSDDDVYRELGMEPPFLLMSRRPGLGREYYERHPDLFDYDKINISTEEGGKSFQAPKYFLSLLEKDDPAKYEKVKEVRKKAAEAAESIAEAASSINWYDRNLQLERIKEAQIKSLRRNRI